MEDEAACPVAAFAMALRRRTREALWWAMKRYWTLERRTGGAGGDAGGATVSVDTLAFRLAVGRRSENISGGVGGVVGAVSVEMSGAPGAPDEGNDWVSSDLLRFPVGTTSMVQK